MDGHVHTAVFKMDNQQGPTVEHRELYSMWCGSLDGRAVWGRMDTCAHIWLSPWAMHLKLSQHCSLAIPQNKSSKKALLKTGKQECELREM